MVYGTQVPVLDSIPLSGVRIQLLDDSSSKIFACTATSASQGTSNIASLTTTTVNPDLLPRFKMFLMLSTWMTLKPISPLFGMKV